MFNFSLVNKVKWYQVLLCVTNKSIKYQSFIYTQLNGKTVYFKQVNLASVRLDRTLSGATTPGQSGLENDSNKGVPRIPQSSSIIAASPSHCLVSYQDTRWGKSYPSTEVQLAYTTAQTGPSALKSTDQVEQSRESNRVLPYTSVK